MRDAGAGRPHELTGRNGEIAKSSIKESLLVNDYLSLPAENSLVGWRDGREAAFKRAYRIGPPPRGEPGVCAGLRCPDRELLGSLRVAWPISWQVADNIYEKLPAWELVCRATPTMSNPTAPSDGKSDTYRYILWGKWTKQLIEAAAAHRLSGLIRRGLSNPGSTQLAQQLRTKLCEIRDSIQGAATFGTPFAKLRQSWAPMRRAGGHLKRCAASRRGSGETLPQLQGWEIPRPGYLREVRRDSMDGAP